MPSSPNQKEVIDIRILRLIGLEDVFDLDYGTYLTLLKEVMVKGRMTKTSIPTEEVELVTEEYKRVKSKKDKGRFKVQKKKITAGSISGSSVKSIAGKISKVKPVALLPGTALKTEKTEEENSEILTSIQETLDSIFKLMAQQEKNVKSAAEKQRRKEENERRKAREQGLEKGFAKVLSVTKKVLAPVKSILDKIIEFFLNIFIGRSLIKLLDWIADPKNKSKVDSVLRFFSDQWPKLLGLYLAFGTKLGRFVTRITATLLKGIVNFSMKNPKVAALFGIGAATLAILDRIRNQAKDKNQDLSDYLQNKTDDDIPVPQYSGGGPVNVIQVLNNGGFISGQKGIDKIPAMLTDGEFVMSRGAVQKFGLDTLLAMNSAGGGTNIPRMVSGVPHAQGGGPIGSLASSARRLLFGQPGLSTGTRATAGFTGMGRPGFEAITRGESYIPSSKPQILGRGAYSAPTYRGAMRYAGTSGSLGGRQTPGGVIRSIVPGGALRIPFLEPQMKVSGSTFDRGKALADKLMSGAYSRSPLANRLRSQMTSGIGQMPKFRMRGMRGSLLSAIPFLLQFAPGAVGRHVRSAYDRQDRDKQEVMQMGMDKLNTLLGRSDNITQTPIRFAGGLSPNSSRRSYSVSPPMQSRTRVMYVNVPSGGSINRSGSVPASGQSVPSFSAVTSDARRYAKAAQLGIG